jgi:hypothetical protein
MLLEEDEALTNELFEKILAFYTKDGNADQIEVVRAEDLFDEE